MSKEKAGVHIVALAIEKDFDWIFREQPSSDYGVDAHIEIKEEGKPLGLLIGIQIKTGKSYFRESTPEGFVYRPDSFHVEYWIQHSLPMIVVLVDDSVGVCYWQKLDRKTIVSTGKGWKVLVPRENVLNTSSKERLLDLAAGFSSPLSQLQLAYPLMKIVKTEESFILEAGRWINKTSGRSEVRLLAGDLGDEKTIEEWPYIILAGVDILTFLREAFPWADLTLDEDFYLQHEEEQWDCEAGVLDDESSAYLFHTEGFEEWKERKGLTGIRPYEITAGEVATYRFRVTLSQLGESYMVVENYLRSTEEPWVVLRGPTEQDV